MEEFYSKGKDCIWLAQQLKDKMGGYVSFNTFGIDNPLLTGVYCKKGTGGPYYGIEDVRFYIKYSKNEFLRIQIDTVCNKEEDTLLAMKELIKNIATIKQDDISIGLPLAIYNTDECITSEYAFKNIEEVKKNLRNNTMFDDGDISNLMFIKDNPNNSLKEEKKDNTNIKRLYKSIFNNKINNKPI